MIKSEKIFRENIKEILENGYSTENEKVRPHYKDGTPSHTLFIPQTYEKYDISKGEFPIISLRPIAWKSGIKEILWIYQDQTNELSTLKEKYNIHWWDDWNVGDGTIGMRYGATVKKYDLMNKLLDGLKNEPYGRRHIMDLYQYSDFEESKGLHPCAFMTLWTVRGEFLDMTLVQRSNDYLVAGHINKIQYVALLMMVAKSTGYKPGIFTHLVQNLHIYDRHIEQAKQLLKRTPSDKQPKLILDTDKNDFYEFTINDFKMQNYDPIKPQLNFELAI
ncbi:thymidylate synthase [Senegalia massiliensis]|uniref:Thymidylate synthase n=1 Tax=Senegalia massiliensis TaxID=1720316 RepID=A0A845QX16_9CLOT|nr:thymidylate synthase [Senegalia massiliensis]NBI05698.1 thymidylate synthase [Senegalia massiliensis]